MVREVNGSTLEVEFQKLLLVGLISPILIILLPLIPMSNRLKKDTIQAKAEAEKLRLQANQPDNVHTVDNNTADNNTADNNTSRKHTKAQLKVRM
jgi:hypothetical protein